VFYILKIMNVKVDQNFEDWVSIGNVALIRGIKQFDKTKGFTESTFLGRCIKYEIIKELTKNNRQSRTPPNGLVYLDGQSKEGKDISEVIRNDIDIEQDYIKQVEKEEFYKIIDKLKPKDKEILVDLYGLYETKAHKQYELTEKYNMTHQGISNRHISALKRLKNLMQKEQYFKERI